ncbi:hypothetical protein JW752_00730 [Candidatus Peregrinibacteria bacterium]|nr:hypothetical protein [Candidatus Peregrinibacteria bacterium]
MKKLFIPIIGLTAILISLLVWNRLTLSAADVPYPNPGAKENPSACVQVVANEMTLMRNGWQENLNTMLDQEKPTSEIVDEAFESLRTYRCWLDYLCETVLFSGNAEPFDMINQETKEPLKLTNEHIDKLPGCVAPENIEIPGTNLHYLEECSAYDSGGWTLPLANKNYESCRRLVNMDFSELEDSGSLTTSQLEKFKENSKAFIGLERALKVNNGEKKNRALQNKLSSILEKMLAMENHMELLKQHLFRLDAMLPCLATKCD